MKLATITLTVAIATPDAAPVAVTTANNVISPQEAFEAAKGLDLPAGVTLIGDVDLIKEPAASTVAATAASATAAAAASITAAATGNAGASVVAAANTFVCPL